MPDPIVTPALKPMQPAPRPILTTIQVAEKPVALSRDGLTLSGKAPGLRNDRFAGLPALDAVSRGGAIDKTDAAAVMAVQDALKAMGFFIPGGVDGKFGRGTAQAVKNFQNAAGLPMTGELDAGTLAALDKHAPPAGLSAWDPGVKPSLIPDPVVRRPDGKPYMEKGKPMVARVVVAIGQHRVFTFDAKGNLQKIYPCRTGTEKHADGRGAFTQPAVKRIDAKMSGDALAEMGARLWNQPGAFGEALLALSKIDPATGKKVDFAYNGQELHGVPDNAKGEPTGLGFDFSHGCVGVSNADIQEISAGLRSGQIVNFIP